MPRHILRRPNPFSPGSTPSQHLPNQLPPWLVWVITSVGLVGLAAFALTQRLTPAILAVLLLDISDSARPTGFSEQACKALMAQINPRDRLVQIQFAARPEKVRDIRVDRRLDLADQCQPTETRITNTWGTDLAAALALAETEIQGKREEGIDTPIALIIALHELEPIPNQSQPTISEIAKLIEGITNHNTFVVIVGPMDVLQTELAQHLKLNAKAHVCSSNDIKNCTIWAVKQARRQHR